MGTEYPIVTARRHGPKTRETITLQRHISKDVTENKQGSALHYTNPRNSWHWTDSEEEDD